MNNFIYLKIFIKEGYTNKETGEKGEPRIQFQNIHLLEKVIPEYAKKIIIQFNIFEITDKKIEDLKIIFEKNKGDKPLQIEVQEIIKNQKANAPIETLEIKENIDIIPENDEEVILDETGELRNIDIDVEEETLVITQIMMPSKKIKVNINNELLQSLELMNVNFSLV